MSNLTATTVTKDESETIEKGPAKRKAQSKSQFWNEQLVINSHLTAHVLSSGIASYLAL